MHLIFLPGNSHSAVIYQPLVERLSRTHPAYQLTIIEHPGSGAAPRWKNYTWTKMRQHVCDQINQLEGPKLVLGHSLAGHFAMEIAEQINELAGLVIIGSPPIKKPINMEEAFAPYEHIGVFFNPTPTEAEIRDVLDGFLFERKELIEKLKQDFESSDPAVRAAVMSTIQNPEEILDEAQLFCDLDCKKFFICGEADPIMNLSYVREVFKNAQTPIEVIPIKNCGHYPQLEKTEVFAKLLMDCAKKCFHPVTQ